MKGANVDHTTLIDYSIKCSVLCVVIMIMMTLTGGLCAADHETGCWEDRKQIDIPRAPISYKSVYTVSDVPSGAVVQTQDGVQVIITFAGSVDYLDVYFIYGDSSFQLLSSGIPQNGACLDYQLSDYAILSYNYPYYGPGSCKGPQRWQSVPVKSPAILYTTYKENPGCKGAETVSICWYWSGDELDAGYGVEETGDLDGYTVEDGDCDNTDPLVNPGMREVMDGKDNDCDGTIDEEWDDGGGGGCFINTAASSLSR
jgi:hypothetical protein